MKKTSNVPLEKTVVYKGVFPEQAPIVVTAKGLHPLTYQQPHFNIHDEWEVGIVLKGVYQDIHSDYRNDLKPGELWWCGPWEPHGYFGPGPETRIIVVEFLPALFSAIPPEDPLSQLLYLPFLRPEIRKLLQPKTSGEKADLRRKFEVMWQIHVKGGLYAPSAIRLHFFQLLLDLLQKHGISQTLPMIPDRTMTERIISVLGFINQNLGEKITLEKVAASTGLSRMQLWRFFRRVMGVTFTDYLLQSRLKKAHREILDGKEKISVIARNCGFSPGHLFKTYIRYYGHTPGQERKK